MVAGENFLEIDCRLTVLNPSGCGLFLDYENGYTGTGENPESVAGLTVYVGLTSLQQFFRDGVKQFECAVRAAASEVGVAFLALDEQLLRTA